MLGLSERIALIVLSVWLIVTGLVSLADIDFPGEGIVLGLLAVAAGVLILLQGQSWSAKFGMIVLGVWLVLRGLTSLVTIGIQGVGLVLNVLAIAAGVLILVEK